MPVTLFDPYSGKYNSLVASIVSCIEMMVCWTCRRRALDLGIQWGMMRSETFCQRVRVWQPRIWQIRPVNLRGKEGIVEGK